MTGIGFARIGESKVVRRRGKLLSKGRISESAPYRVVVDYLKHELKRGRWLPGSQMPSESELVRRFGFSRMTINRAVRELQSTGLVERVRGAGTFAAQLNRVSSTLTIRDLHEEIISRGHTHKAEIQLAQEERLPRTLSEHFGLAAGTRVFHTVIVHHEDGMPLQLEDRYVNPECAPDYLAVDFTRTTPTHYLLEVAPVWEAQYSIESGLPTTREAKLLKVNPGEPCLVVTRRTANSSAPITYVRLVHPGSRYQIEGRFKP
jgi:GntR family histidine utilization transcriptional repressor